MTDDSLNVHSTGTDNSEELGRKPETYELGNAEVTDRSLSNS